MNDIVDITYNLAQSLPIRKIGDTKFDIEMPDEPKRGCLSNETDHFEVVIREMLCYMAAYKTCYTGNQNSFSIRHIAFNHNLFS